MMKVQKYAILRDVSRPRLAGPGIPPRMFAGAMPAEHLAPEPAVEVVELSPADMKDVSRDPMVAAAAPSIPIKLHKPVTMDVDSDAMAGEITWGVRAVGADTSSYDGTGIKVGIIDTGLDTNHAAFNGLNVEQRDYTGDGPGDADGHGTHCSGTIFGRDVNGIRIGVARGVSDVFVARIFGDDGSGSGSAVIAEAVNDAVNAGCQVISMSIGFDFPGLTAALIEQYGSQYDRSFLAALALSQYRSNVRLFDALGEFVEARAAQSAEVLLVAASGNESGRDKPTPYELPAAPPGEASGFISVGAVGKQSNSVKVAGFSNTACNVVGPGVNVRSAKAGTTDGLVNFNGTSMATPHVAGVAALWLQRIAGLPTPPGYFPPRGSRALGRLLGQATMSMFTAGYDPVDVGNGLVQAPQMQP